MTVSNHAILTVYEGHYHFGVASLINSAICAGFSGRFFIGFRDVIPPWTKQLSKINELNFSIRGNRITFYKDDPTRHLGFHKAFAALAIFEQYPEVETIHYADPDVAFLAPWEFFINWAKLGIGLVRDVNFREVATRHPWRYDWALLLTQAGYTVPDKFETGYANGGYFVINRRDGQFLKMWANITLAYERSGGNTASYQMIARWKAVVSDQDLLAAALMGWTGSVSLVGPEAMGFTGYYFILSHAIESPKPWDKCFLLQALRGWPPSRPAKEYLHFSNQYIRVCGKWMAMVRSLDFRAAQLVARIYRR